VYVYFLHVSFTVIVPSTFIGLHEVGLNMTPDGADY
jgi:enoyl-CoA hydratase/carnithine racemase